MSTVTETARALIDPADFAGKIHIDGEWVTGGGGEIASTAPATGETLAMVGLADAGDVARAAEGAARAQKAWAALPHPARAAVLRRAGQLWEQHADEIGGWNIREVGAIPPLAGFALHVTAAECYEASALPSAPSRVDPLQRRAASVAGRAGPGRSGRGHLPVQRAADPRHPRGCARARTRQRRAAQARPAHHHHRWRVDGAHLRGGGAPTGLLQLVPGGAEVGEAMVTEPRVRVIAFTGSTRAGRSVGELAGRHLKRAHLELGGNSAYVIRADADVDKAVNLATWGSFLHQGQICMTVGRHIVHESLFDEYVEKLAAKAESMHVGDPAAGQVHLGPLIDEVQRDRVHTLVQDAVAQGAELRAGGTYDRLFYRPTVLANTPRDAAAYCDEVFGPVASVVSFSTDDEAVALASETDYGLSLGIVTADVFAGLEMARRIPSGIVHINDQTVNDEANAPFGGTGSSGTGSRHGGAQASIDAFTETRWITMRREPGQYPL